MNRVYKRVKANKGVAGVDVMKVEEEPELLKEHKRAKAKLKKLTSRSQGRNVRTVMQNAKTFMQGWLNYYSIADMQRTMEDWNGWLCRRIRMYIWKQWKNPRTRVTNLDKLGMPHWKAYINGNSRKGYCAIAESCILQSTITNERLAQAGYFDISPKYKSMHYSGKRV